MDDVLAIAGFGICLGLTFGSNGSTFGLVICFIFCHAQKKLLQFLSW